MHLVTRRNERKLKLCSPTMNDSSPSKKSVCQTPQHAQTHGEFTYRANNWKKRPSTWTTVKMDSLSECPSIVTSWSSKQTDYNVDTCSNHGFTHLHLKSSWICLSTEQLTTGSSNWNRRTVDLFPVSEADLTTQSFWALEVVEVFKLVLSILLVCLETALYRSGPTSSWTKSAVTQFTVALWHESDQRVVLCFVQSARCIPQLNPSNGSVTRNRLHICSIIYS